MKRYGLWMALLLWFQASWALEATVDYAVFQQPSGAYLEIYLHLVGRSLKYVPIDTLYQQATVEVVLLFKQQDRIVKADKFRLSSPLSKQAIDFVDLKRYALAPANYDLEVTITDVQNADTAWTYQAPVSVNFQLLTIQQSDIQLLTKAESSSSTTHPFYKQRFILEPLPTLRYHKAFLQLLAYNEVYPNAYSGDLQIRYFVQVVGQSEPIGLKISQRKTTTKAVIPLVLGVNIQELATGSYELVVEVRDSTGNLLTNKKKNFYRHNPYLQGNLTLSDLQQDSFFVHPLDEKVLNYSLKALLPKINQKYTEQLNNTLKSSNLDEKRLLLLNFWIEQNASQPQTAYESYMQVVKAVDREYKSGFRNGFETDRGYYYLKYGRPDDIVGVEDEPSAPPYEIWSYNYFPTTRQSNVRFLFYNPSLAGGDYILLHATAQGERNNPNWEVELYRNAPNEIEGDDPFGATQMKDNLGRRARKLMSDF